MTDPSFRPDFPPISAGPQPARGTGPGDAATVDPVSAAGDGRGTPPPDTDAHLAARNVQYKGAPLEADRGPGLGCFWIQIVVLAIAVIITPLSVVWGWPEGVSAALLFLVVLLLLLTGQTVIFLLRLVAADRRAEGRRRPLASATKTVGELEDERAADVEDERAGDAEAPADIPADASNRTALDPGKDAALDPGPPTAPDPGKDPGKDSGKDPGGQASDGRGPVRQ